MHPIRTNVLKCPQTRTLGFGVSAQKFKFLANDSLGEEGVGRVVDLVDRLESLADIKKLTANL